MRSRSIRTVTPSSLPRNLSRSLSLSLTLSLGLSMAACDDTTRDGDAVDIRQSSSAIVHGEASPSYDDAVVALASRPGGGFGGICTGTLIASNLVITARHCVSVTDRHAQCGADGSSVAGGAVHSDYRADEMFVYRGANATADLVSDLGKTPVLAAARGARIVVEGSSFCNGDIAFLVLDSDLDGPTAPIRLGETRTGDSLTAVGYGLDEQGKLADQRLRRPDIEVVATGALDFGDGLGLGNAELLVGESACSGDSGGPLLSPATGAVVAVLSRGGGGDGPTDNRAGSCTGRSAHMIYTHLASKRDLLKRAAEASARRIAVEDPWMARARVEERELVVPPARVFVSEEELRQSAGLADEGPTSDASAPYACAASAVTGRADAPYTLALSAALGVLVVARRRRARG